MPDTHPFTQVLTLRSPGQATAGTDSTFALGRAPFACTVTDVTYAPEAAITGANTNTRRVALVNKGQTGAGAVEPAALQFDSGVNAAAFDDKPITLSATQANRVLAAGDILAWFSDAIGTGQADPGGLVCVTVSRN